MTALRQEVTMELLGDLATAIRSVAANTFPSLPLKVAIIARPKASIVITVEDDADPVYGHILSVRAENLHLTNEGRKLLGLPLREE